MVLELVAKREVSVGEMECQVVCSCGIFVAVVVVAVLVVQ